MVTATGQQTSLPEETAIGRVALCVRDLDEMVEFYREVIGLAVLTREGSHASLGAGETPLLVLEAAPNEPARSQSQTGLYHVAIRVPTRSALGDGLARVREDWRLDGASDHHVSEALYLSDPEGNGVEIYRDRPRDEWRFTPDGAVHMTTDPLDLEKVSEAAVGEVMVPPETDIGHVHLEVSDLERARDFYVDTLGFERRATVPEAWFFAAGGYHHHVGANTWQGRTSPAGGRGLAWFEIILPDPDVLQAIQTRVSARGTPLAEADEGIQVTDPDGIAIRLRAKV